MADLPAARKSALTQAGSLHPLLLVVWRVLRGAVAALLRTLHLLWLEVTGFFFVVFAVIGGAAAVREYRAWTAGVHGPGRTVAALIFTLVFGYFGVTSFWEARRKSRSHGR